jgi:hypothetical protein
MARPVAEGGWTSWPTGHLISLMRGDLLGIAREFGPGPDPRSRKQQANLLCDDDAELLVILGVEVDAVGVA